MWVLILSQGCEFVAQPCHHHACSKQSSYNLVTTIIIICFIITLSPPCYNFVTTLFIVNNLVSALLPSCYDLVTSLYNLVFFIWEGSKLFTITLKLHSISFTYTFPSGVEVSGDLKSRNNSTQNDTIMVDCDQLIGQQMIDMIMNKPGMIRWFKL